MRIGFIGLGNMGGPMALNLLKAGHALVVHDVRREIAVRRISTAAPRGRRVRAPPPRAPSSS